MAQHPSALWKGMPLDKRLRAAEAFWRDTSSPEIAAEHAEAAASLARRLNFRVKSVRALPVDRRARYLAQMPDIPESIASRALVAYHFADRRELMTAFLDALGIAHEGGLITSDDLQRPETGAIAKALPTLRERFEAADVDLYLRTLAALDGDTWVNIDTALAADPVGSD